ncbi:hypothetical protein [Actinophytocola sp.]|uniref:hypothetical protein n=1 Tax=Actinophytocola sp. TaxID=1872138 RepID=UPI00389B0DA4
MVTKALAAIMLAATVLVAMTLLAGCTTTSPPASPHIPLPQPADTGQSTARTPPLSGAETTPPVDMPRVDTPQAVAIQWLSAYHSATWTDPNPAAWIDRVRPYVTDAMHTRNTSLRDGGAGNDWTDFVSQRCRSNVSDPAAVIPAEAPGNSDTANVLVAGTVTTTCADGTDSSIEQASATLVVVKTSNGWRVDERLF